MRILINSHEVDFALETEKTIPEVVSSMVEWAGERGLILLEVHVDGVVHAPDRVPEIAIDQVGELDCRLESQAETIFSTAGEAITYCGRAIAFIDENQDSGSISAEDASNLAEGVQWLTQVLVSVVHLLAIDPGERLFRDATVASRIEALEKLAELMRQGLTPEVLTDARELLAGAMELLRFFLSGDEMRRLVLAGIESPDALMESLSALRSGFAGERDNLMQSAAAFQAGRDGEGADKLNNFIDFVYRYSRTCVQLEPVFGLPMAEVEVGDNSLEELHSSLQDHLSQVLDAMENDDIITLADILEYEITPLMDKIENSLELLEGRLSG